jgi:hypothetical protein
MWTCALLVRARIPTIKMYVDDEWHELYGYNLNPELRKYMQENHNGR